MSGPSKHTKGLGQFKKRRHRKILRDSVQGTAKPSIRRVCRRAGVKRLDGCIYEETRGALSKFLNGVLHDSVAYADQEKRKTIMADDVIHALKWTNCTLYGYSS